MTRSVPVVRRGVQIYIDKCQDPVQLSAFKFLEGHKHDPAH